MRRFVLLALLAVPGSISSQSAVNESGVYGYVLAPGGVPASSGTIVYSSFAASTSVTIDSAGRFRIPVDRTGIYHVTVSMPKFLKVTTFVVTSSLQHHGRRWRSTEIFDADGDTIASLVGLGRRARPPPRRRVIANASRYERM
jgi:hypothetical protein